MVLKNRFRNGTYYKQNKLVPSTTNDVFYRTFLSWCWNDVIGARVNFSAPVGNSSHRSTLGCCEVNTKPGILWWSAFEHPFSEFDRCVSVRETRSKVSLFETREFKFEIRVFQFETGVSQYNFSELPFETWLILITVWNSCITVWNLSNIFLNSRVTVWTSYHIFKFEYFNLKLEYRSLKLKYCIFETWILYFEPRVLHLDTGILHFWNLSIIFWNLHITVWNLGLTFWYSHISSILTSTIHVAGAASGIPQ